MHWPLHEIGGRKVRSMITGLLSMSLSRDIREEKRMKSSSNVELLQGCETAFFICDPGSKSPAPASDLQHLHVAPLVHNDSEHHGPWA